MFADRGKLALERGEIVEITLVSGMSFLDSICKSRAEKTREGLSDGIAWPLWLLSAESLCKPFARK